MAKEAGETLRSDQFDFPPGDIWTLRKLPGMEDDASVEILDPLKAMWGLKDAPRAFIMRLSRSLQEIGDQQGVIDKQVWRKFDKNAKP
eukprot:5693012-Prorocentrum_lima.AAC.1